MSTTGTIDLSGAGGYERRIGARKPSRSIIICLDNCLAKDPFGRRNIGHKSHLVEQLFGGSSTCGKRHLVEALSGVRTI